MRDPRLTVEDHELAVEVLDRADAEVGSRQQVTDAEIAVVVPVHQSGHRAGLHHQMLLRSLVQQARSGECAHVQCADQPIVDDVSSHGATLARIIRP